MDTKEEIRLAIEAVQEEGLRIVEMPSLPDFEYVWTCKSCGSHNTPARVVIDGAVLFVCGFCNHVSS